MTSRVARAVILRRPPTDEHDENLQRAGIEHYIIPGLPDTSAYKKYIESGKILSVIQLPLGTAQDTLALAETIDAKYVFIDMTMVAISDPVISTRTTYVISGENEYSKLLGGGHVNFPHRQAVLLRQGASVSAQIKNIKKIGNAPIPVFFHIPSENLVDFTQVEDLIMPFSDTVVFWSPTTVNHLSSRIESSQGEYQEGQKLFITCLRHVAIRVAPSVSAKLDGSANPGDVYEFDGFVPSTMGRIAKIYTGEGVVRYVFMNQGDAQLFSEPHTVE